MSQKKDLLPWEVDTKKKSTGSGTSGNNKHIDNILKNSVQNKGGAVAGSGSGNKKTTAGSNKATAGSGAKKTGITNSGTGKKTGSGATNNKQVANSNKKVMNKKNSGSGKKDAATTTGKSDSRMKKKPPSRNRAKAQEASSDDFSSDSDNTSDYININSSDDGDDDDDEEDDSSSPDDSEDSRTDSSDSSSNGEPPKRKAPTKKTSTTGSSFKLIPENDNFEAFRARRSEISQQNSSITVVPTFPIVSTTPASTPAKLIVSQPLPRLEVACAITTLQPVEFDYNFINNSFKNGVISLNPNMLFIVSQPIRFVQSVKIMTARGPSTNLEFQGEGKFVADSKIIFTLKNLIISNATPATLLEAHNLLDITLIKVKFIQTTPKESVQNPLPKVFIRNCISGYFKKVSIQDSSNVGILFDLNDNIIIKKCNFINNNRYNLDLRLREKSFFRSKNNNYGQADRACVRIKVDLIEGSNPNRGNYVYFKNDNISNSKKDGFIIHDDIWGFFLSLDRCNIENNQRDGVTIAIGKIKDCIIRGNNTGLIVMDPQGDTEVKKVTMKNTMIVGNRTNISGCDEDPTKMFCQAPNIEELHCVVD